MVAIAGRGKPAQREPNQSSQAVADDSGAGACVENREEYVGKDQCHQQRAGYRLNPMGHLSSSSRAASRAVRLLPVRLAT